MSVKCVVLAEDLALITNNPISECSERPKNIPTSFTCLSFGHLLASPKHAACHFKGDTRC